MAMGTRSTAAIAAANAADRAPATPAARPGAAPSHVGRGAADAAPASSPSKARSALMRSSVPDDRGPQGCCSAASTSLSERRSSLSPPRPTPVVPPSPGTGRREAGSKMRDEDAAPPGGFAWRRSSGVSLPATLPPDDPLLWLLPAGAAAAGCEFNSATSEDAAVGWRSNDKSAEMAVASSRMPPLLGAVTAAAAAAAGAGAASRDGELLVSATTSGLEAAAAVAAVAEVVAPCARASRGSCSNPKVLTLASPPRAAARPPAAAAAALP